MIRIGLGYFWCVCIGLPFMASAADAPWRVGVATGYGVGSSIERDFRQGDVIASYRLARFDGQGDTWRWDIHALLGAGFVRDRDTTSFTAGLGPGVDLLHIPSRLRLHGGSRATYLESPEFPSRDLGGEIQFISHIGISYEGWSRLAMGIRLQHLSNAGRVNPNPGLNTLLVEASFSW